MSKSLNKVNVGKVLLEYERLSSTNAYTQHLLQHQKLEEGTVIVTTDQIAGRGQMGTTWHSQPGKNLTLSVVFYPTFLGVAQQFQLSKMVALAVWQFVSSYFPELVKIKWPNDIYIGDSKVGGVLIQNQLKRRGIEHSIVGVGININQTLFPEEATLATSFKQINEKTYQLDTLRRVLFSHLTHYYELLANNSLEIDREYKANLYRMGEVALYKDLESGTDFSAQIIGVDPSGRLLLQTANQIKSYSLKEIKFL